MTASLPRRRSVFVDTSAYGALADRADQDHSAAIAINRYLTEKRIALVTTNFVIAETHALVLSRAGRDIAFALLQRLDASAGIVVRVGENDEREARRIIASYHDKDFSLVDAMSFAVMTRLAITSAFTFDWHFQQFGFVVVDPT
jgi:predicted nucleic acid-binding protein